MSKGIDLSHIYNLRNNFTVIGLTGQIGSGCSEVAEQLSRGFNNRDFETLREVGGIDNKTSEIKHNSYRKYRIVYNYAKDNFKGYTRINYKDVLVIFLLQNSFDAFINFLKSSELKNELETEVIRDDEGKELEAIVPIASFDYEVNLLIEVKNKFETLSEKYMSIEDNLNELYDFYFNSEFLSLCSDIHSKLRGNSRVKRNKLLQVISTNLRRSGNPYKFSEPTADNIFKIVDLINRIIKSHRNASSIGKSTQIDPLPPKETDPRPPFQIDPLIPAQTDPPKT